MSIRDNRAALRQIEFNAEYNEVIPVEGGIVFGIIGWMLFHSIKGVLICGFIGTIIPMFCKKIRFAIACICTLAATIAAGYYAWYFTEDMIWTIFAVLIGFGIMAGINCHSNEYISDVMARDEDK